VNKAAPDPLGEAATGILAHMNADHIDGMILLAGLACGDRSDQRDDDCGRLGFSLSLEDDSWG